MYTISDVYKQENLVLSYQRLVTNPESTYKDFFRDTYSTYAMALDKNICFLRSKVKAGYLPATSIRTFMPKANGLSRMYTLLTIEDQIVYQAYANVIAEALFNISQIRNRYKKSVFGNLYAGKGSIFFYQKWQDSYKAYTKSIIKSYERGNKYIASFDLTACYDSINHRLLYDILTKKCRLSDNCAKSFVQLLEKWESADRMELGTGIPQGPQASGIIAESVLAEYDSFIEGLQKNLSFQYFRYVDDIRILAKDERTVQWVLFLLDIKSKELGLFPQSSKIVIHEITNIDEEIKRISKPLFDDEFDDDKNAKIAVKAIQKMLKEDPADLTTIKRYFRYVKQDSKSNKLAISAVRKYPNMIHSFAYYVKRYPRKVPQSICAYIEECCCDKTRQFAAGMLLESVIGNLTIRDSAHFCAMATDILKADRKNKFIVDDRYKLQLITLILLYGNQLTKQQRNIIADCSWWIKSKLMYQIARYDLDGKIGPNYIIESLQSSSSDIALAGAHYYLIEAKTEKLPAIRTLSPVAQNLLKQAGLIQRSQYSNSQIQRYLGEITETKISFGWKKKLGREHNQLERTLFVALGYWKTDLTAFVNLWDTMDDRICSLLTVAHPELGGYTFGKIGCIEKSKKFISYLPKFHKMCMEIHELRLSSHLSHAEIRRTQKYTGPIQQQKRKQIKRLIAEGISELVEYW